jgi:hypothetical protein
MLKLNFPSAHITQDANIGNEVDSVKLALPKGKQS